MEGKPQASTPAVALWTEQDHPLAFGRELPWCLAVYDFQKS